MKTRKIIGGYAHECDMCNQETWPTLYWKEKDFDLCYDCIAKLFINFVIEEKEISKIKGIKVIRKTINEEVRNTIFKRDNYKCIKCGSNKDLVIDHIMPFPKGGVTELNNLQTLCKKCNREKGNKTNK